MIKIDITNITDLNNWLLERGFSQQTVFDWFGFNSRAIYRAPMLNTLSGDANAAAFTPETYDMFVTALYNKVRYGLVFPDLRNICIAILVIRFVLFAIRYGIFPALKIVFICGFAGAMWYRHMYTTFTLHNFMVSHLPIFNSLSIGYDRVENLKAIRRELGGDKINFKATFDFLWEYNTRGDFYFNKATGETSIFRGYTVSSEVRYRTMVGELEHALFHIDPIALAIKSYSLTGFPLDKLLIKTYFLFSRYLNQKLIADIFPQLWKNMGNGMTYAIFVRFGKRYTPYFIRWYWTADYLMGVLEYYFLKFIRRFLVYIIFVITPKYHENYFSRHPNAKDVPESILPDLKNPFALEYLVNHLAIELLISLLFLFHFLMTLHAFCGQYIYIPFVTENIELNIGKRPKNSIYSGGSTAWQDISPNKMQYWFGWFGRGTDKPSIFVLIVLLLKWIIVKILEILRLKKIFLRFFKFLRNKFKNQK